MTPEHEAIYALYPLVTTIAGLTAFDKDENKIEIDMVLVEAKIVELAAKAETDKQAQVANKQAALAKLMALGLTEAEALALGVK